MPPKRREQTDKNKEVGSMPELEELPADEEHREMSVQNMVDRIEGHSHGHAITKQPAESHEEIPEKNTVEMEEASKMMAEGILAYVKAVVSHITQSTTQGSFQHKGVEQGAGSSRAGETRRSIPTPPSLDERYTPPHQKDEAVFQRSPVMRAMNEKRVKAYWIPKGQIFEAHRNYGGSTTKYVSRGSPGNIGGSDLRWPRNQYFANEKKRTHHSENLSHRIE
ncbi:patatin-like protein 2 [Dorcoceras hygrometricum]|uniref:Patatin-like protein 2 n=1 Tax=Dorcoceras hygrometricum TaxID=472368 RepID=A0A2Z7BWJ3_9LAMI|nr:patatin-like protein 2 [Dorcoceras hygrometricum]